MENVDLILISQSEVVNYEDYSKLPIDRIDLYNNLIYPRMVYYKNGFRSHLDVLNKLQKGIFWTDASPSQRRDLYSIWNLPGFVGPHLANYLKAFDINTHIINNFDSEWDIFCETYDQCDPKPLVGISTTFHLNFVEINRLCKMMRAKYPDIAIALGGAFINGQMYGNDPAPLTKAMKKYGVKYALHGFNSEIDLKDLTLAHKAKSNDYSSINNLVYLSNKSPDISYEITKSLWHDPLIKNIPNHWDDLDLSFVNNTIQIRTASGCPFSCAFCSYPETAGGHFAMPIEVVEEQIKTILKRSNINKIIFLDDTFNVPARRFRDLCAMFTKYKFEWFSFLRVQYIDEEIAHLMSESGCRGVYLGVESANDEVLRNMNKRATRSDFERGIALLNKHDIAMMVAFVVGFPGETEKTLQENKEFVERNGIQFYSLKEFYYLENTSIHRDRAKFGLTGMGNKWQHNTMNSVEASAHKLRLFRSIKSVSIDPDTSLWYLAYLYDQGFSMKEIANIQTDINLIMEAQMSGDFNDNNPLFNQISQKLKNIKNPLLKYNVETQNVASASSKKY